MALAVKDLIDAGVHFGHRASRWNPKMKPYIYGKRNLIHIIDLKETVRGLLRGTKFFHRVAAENGLILFVGTKRQAADTIKEQAERCGMPYVTERWLGGTLTNFRTIRSRLERLEDLEHTLESDQALTYSKKMIAALSRERRKIQRNLEGIRHMTRLPQALLVVDPHREKIAVTEARKLGIKVVALLDTDCDPDEIDLPIPGNDDSMRSIDLVVTMLADAILRGKAEAPAEPPPAPGPRSRWPGAAGTAAIDAAAGPLAAIVAEALETRARPRRIPRPRSPPRPPPRTGRTGPATAPRRAAGPRRGRRARSRPGSRRYARNAGLTATGRLAARTRRQRTGSIAGRSWMEGTARRRPQITRSSRSTRPYTNAFSRNGNDGRDHRPGCE
ncbi:MAG: 30S ribosomal protein S2 [Isosphaeraceae bacterium]